jgi:hypothetical protein
MNGHLNAKATALSHRRSDDIDVERIGISIDESRR